MAGRDIQDIINESMDKVHGTKDEKVSEKVTNEIKIKGKTYTISPLDADDGLNCWEYILKIILPSAGTGIDAMKHDPELDGPPTTFSEALLLLSDKLQGSTFRDLSRILLADAKVDNEPLDYTKEFVANYGVWQKVFTHALKVNFSSFFEEGWAQGLMGIVSLVSPQTASQE